MIALKVILTINITTVELITSGTEGFCNWSKIDYIILYVNGLKLNIIF